MTSNQINYANLRRQRAYDAAALAESKRANLEREKLEDRKLDIQHAMNTATINYNVAKLREENRHSLAQENKDLMVLNESSRHNIAMENLQTQANQLTSARDYNTYQLGLSNLAELSKHNAVTEAQQQQSISNQYSKQQHDMMLNERKLTQSNLLEYQKQMETERSNRAKEQETQRHDMVMEDIQSRATTANVLTNTSREINSWYKTLVPKNKR